uniref:Uncharacterized protein n=1 Tax=Leersia perrieri TaxID=77586 RepID=A0A0D9X734_9ORYZ
MPAADLQFPSSLAAGKNDDAAAYQPIAGNELIFPDHRRAAASALPLGFPPPTPLWTIPCRGATSTQPSLRRRRPPLPVIAAGALTVSGHPACTSRIVLTFSTFSLLDSTAAAPPIVDAEAIFAAAPAQPALPE